MTRPWLIYSREHNAWWKPNECGYTATIDEAGRYRTEDADRIVAHANKYLKVSEVWGVAEFKMLAPECSDVRNPTAAAAVEALYFARQTLHTIWTTLAADPHPSRPVLEVLQDHAEALLRTLEQATIAGICSRCGCTDTHGCAEGCGWVDELHTRCC